MLDVPAKELAAHLRELGGEVPLAERHAGDLYLAFACLRDDAKAWRELDRHFLSNVPRWIRTVDPKEAIADDVRQRLGVKLSKSGEAKLRGYSGRGPLVAWLRTAALREARDITRARKSTEDADAVSLRAPGGDPEMALLRRRSSAVFKRVFGEVMKGLPADERAMLKAHYLDGLTLEQTAKVLRVSRASAARALAEARTRIVKRVERTLRDELGNDAPRVESLLAFVETNFELSISAQLKSGDA